MPPTFFYARRYSVDSTKEYDPSAVDLSNDAGFIAYASASGTLGVSTNIITGISTFAVNPNDYVKSIEDTIQAGTRVLSIGFESIFIDQESTNISVATTTFYFGTYPPYSIPDPIEDLEVDKFKINSSFYDAFATTGTIGQVLLTDSTKVYWGEVSSASTPLQRIGLYDEDIFQGTIANLNFIDSNDPENLVKAQINGINTSFGDIFISDRWSKVTSFGVTNIYRNSKVGIFNNNPVYDLDISGNLHATSYVNFDSDLNVVGVTTLQNRLNVVGVTTLQNRLNVLGPASLSSTLSVVGVTTLQDQLNVLGPASLSSTLSVVGVTTLQDQLNVVGPASLSSTLSVVGVTTLQNRLDVVGVTTLRDQLNVLGPASLSSTLNVVGVTTLRDQLNVVGPTTLQSTLKVGVGGTVITTTDSGYVGFGTSNPQRDVEFYNKDVFFNNGAIYDSNNNVGFRTEKYQVPRNVLTTVGVDTTGNIIGGRFYDAANLIRLNLDFIANEAVGFITSIDYKSPAFSLTTSNYISCKDDIKDIFKAITYDITRGGNSRSVGAGLSYYNGNTLVHITGTDVNGYSIKDASIAAIQKAVEVSRFVINNSYYPTSYQMGAINGTYADAGRLILRNKDFIASEAVDRVVYDLSFTIPTGNQSCIDDIRLILDSIIYNLQFGGNSRVYDAARFYTLNSVLSGEESQSIYAYEQVKSICIDIIRNNTVTKRTGILNTYTQYKDLTILVDPVSPTCQSQASAITSFVGIVTNAIEIGASSLPTRTEPTISIPVSQIRDLTLQNDSSRGSNTDPYGCSNVLSAITVCAGIVTSIIGIGPSASPNVTNPDGKIFWAPAGADSRNIIYVSKYGNDDNNGRTEGAAKLTIGAAAAVAQPGDTIMIRSGVYAENNPIGLRNDVTVSGQDLRLVTIYPQNDNDVFYVRRGCLIENLSFAYSKDPYDDAAPIIISGAAVAFPPPSGIGSARSGYLDPGPASEGPTGRWRSPYIRNCTNFMSGSIGMKINGNHATASTVGNDLKCMVCDSFTQYNENGIGVSITNNGYAQLVSIFTINCNIAIYCDSGGSCDLTNSNSSFGNFGLVAVGLGSTEYTGAVSTYPPTRPLPGVDAGSDVVTFANVIDSNGNPRRPYDGQALFFKINLNNYPDAVGSGIIQSPMVQVQSIKVINGGYGFSAASPPTIIIRDAADQTQNPKGPQGIIAEVSPTIDEVSGSITAIDVINAGRNYLPTQNLEVFIDGGDLVGAAATVITQPIYYTIDSATQTTITGITTVTFNEFIPYELFGNEEVSFKRISRILTSSHSFEYIGTGTNINTATPFQGAVPIKENEVVALDGAQIPFTSTDQKGNFDIGEGFQINQPTATIRGRDFSKAIQAEVTPLILALR